MEWGTRPVAVQQLMQSARQRTAPSDGGTRVTVNTAKWAAYSYCCSIAAVSVLVE